MFAQVVIAMVPSQAVTNTCASGETPVKASGTSDMVTDIGASRIEKKQWAVLHYCIDYYPEINQVVRFPLVSPHSGFRECATVWGEGGDNLLSWVVCCSSSCLASGKKQEVTELLKLDQMV